MKTAPRFHGDSPLKQLNPIDRLYFFYLAAVAVLALWRGPGGARIGIWHAAIALAIALAAMNEARFRVLRFVHDWYPLAMFIFSFEEIAHFSLSVVPLWRDAAIVVFEDSLFGTSPNLWLGNFSTRPLSEFMDFGYFSYYPMFPLAAGLLYGYARREAFHRLVLSSVMMYLMTFSVYVLFPLEGPRRALPGFIAPVRGYVFSWLVHLIQGGAGVHGNALPSSHVGLAVLCSIYAWCWNRTLGVLFAVCTVLISVGAVYNGYHYLSDVLAGVCVAAMAYAVTHNFFSETSTSSSHILNA